MAVKNHTTTPLATAAATSRVPYAQLEAGLAQNAARNKQQPLELVQKALMAGTRGAKKPTLAAVATAIGTAVS